MDLRTTIRRASAVAALYLKALIRADVEYKGCGYDSAEKDARLDVWLAYKVAVQEIACAIGSWSAYPTLREGTTIGARLAGDNARLDHAAWLARVGADLDERIAAPAKGKRKPLPVFTPAPRPAEIGIVQTTDALVLTLPPPTTIHNDTGGLH